jgi:hypothetical protein
MMIGLRINRVRGQLIDHLYNIEIGRAAGGQSAVIDADIPAVAHGLVKLR